MSWANIRSDIVDIQRSAHITEGGHATVFRNAYQSVRSRSLVVNEHDPSRKRKQE